MEMVWLTVGGASEFVQQEFIDEIALD